MSLMAGVTFRRVRNLFSRRVALHREESPAAFKTRRVLHVGLETHDLAGLEQSLPVNRAFRFRHAVLQHQHGLVGPHARALERGVSGRRRKYIVELVGVGHRRAIAVTHVHARAQENPLAIRGWRDQPSVRVVLRRVRVPHRDGDRAKNKSRGRGGENGEQARPETHSEAPVKCDWRRSVRHSSAQIYKTTERWQKGF